MAPAGTRIGLLAVDQSVYLLRNDNRLTKDRVGGLGSRHPQHCIEGSSLSLGRPDPLRLGYLELEQWTFHNPSNVLCFAIDGSDTNAICIFLQSTVALHLLASPASRPLPSRNLLSQAFTHCLPPSLESVRCCSWSLSIRAKRDIWRLLIACGVSLSSSPVYCI